MHTDIENLRQQIRPSLPNLSALQTILLGLSLLLTPGFTCKETISSRTSTIKDEHFSNNIRFTRVSIPLIKKSLWDHSAKLPFQDPTIEQLNALSRAIQLAASMENTSKIDTLRILAREAGFDVALWQMNDQRLVALIESRKTLAGLGAYLFRLSPVVSSRPLLLQAPHSYFDKGTGILALRTFFVSAHEAPSARALFVNTRHRYIGSDGVKQKREYNPADVCHNSEHSFNLATEAFVKVFPALRVIQLHGFSTKKHKENLTETKAAPSNHKSNFHSAQQMVLDSRMKVILSAGNIHHSPPELRRLRDHLQEKIDFRFQVFPEDTKQLGATSNVQGRLLRRYPKSLFVHIEMSREARQSLKQDVARFEAFSIELLKVGLESG